MFLFQVCGNSSKSLVGLIAQIRVLKIQPRGFARHVPWRLPDVAVFRLSKKTARLRVSEVPDSCFSRSRILGLRLVLMLLPVVFGEDFGVVGRGQSGFGTSPAHAVSPDVDAVGVVDDAVQDRVCDGGFVDHLMPTRDRQPRRDDGGSALVAVFEQLEEVSALMVGQSVGAPGVEDEALIFGEPVDHADEVRRRHHPVTLSEAGTLCLRVAQRWGANQLTLIIMH